MKIREERVLARMGGSLCLTIPSYVAKGLGWKEGDNITFEVIDDKVELSKSRSSK